MVFASRVSAVLLSQWPIFRNSNVFHGDYNWDNCRTTYNHDQIDYKIGNNFIVFVLTNTKLQDYRYICKL